jgi:hypothetical protein
METPSMWSWDSFTNDIAGMRDNEGPPGHAGFFPLQDYVRDADLFRDHARLGINSEVGSWIS